MSDKPRPFCDATFLTFLVQQNHLTEQTARRVALAAKETATGVERVVLELGLMEEDKTYYALAEFLELPYVTMEMIDHGLIKSDLLKSDFMKRAMTIPVAQTDDGYTLATATTDMDDLISAVEFLLEVAVHPVIASPSTINAALNLASTPKETQADAATTSDVARLQALANDGPVINLVNDIIGRAVTLGASDVHIETQQNGARVRCRINGLLQVDRMIPDDIRSSVMSRLKIMANLNISERRRPQDGRADVVVRGRSIDIRVSTLPTQYGESIVLRLLDRNRVQLDWTSLKFPSDLVSQIEKMMANPNGIFLVAGPTGSGKTTTLYTALKGINSDDRKILTVEDPIEYALDGANQVQVDTAIDMSFAKALRAILRQDPNVVMVGEIRDEETAEVAVRAALIGRLVLSTIHTNDSVSAVDRLLDLGVAPYLVGATLRGVLSQRLVRANCKACHAEGCNACDGTGYVGRMAVAELLTISPNLSDAITQGARGATLRDIAIEEGFVSMTEEAESLVTRGFVSKSETYRAFGFQ